MSSSNVISSAIDKAKKMTSAEKGAKISQLDEISQGVTKDDRITSDFGVRQGNTDDWYRVTTNDTTGPMLLEDSFSREKVRQSFFGRVQFGMLTLLDPPI